MLFQKTDPSCDCITSLPLQHFYPWPTRIGLEKHHVPTPAIEPKKNISTTPHNEL